MSKKNLLTTAALLLLGSISTSSFAAKGTGGFCHHDEDGTYHCTTSGGGGGGGGGGLGGWTWGPSGGRHEPGGSGGPGGPGGGGSGGGGTSGGNTSTGNTSTTAGDPTKDKAACITKMKQNNNLCLLVSRGRTVITAGACLTFIIPPAVAACEVGNAVVGLYGEWDCTDMQIDTESYCNTLP